MTHLSQEQEQELARPPQVRQQAPWPVRSLERQTPSQLVRQAQLLARSVQRAQRPAQRREYARVHVHVHVHARVRVS